MDRANQIPAAELPLVSVCIPTCNGASYIEACLQSIAAQTYPNVELLISDDASEDNTLELCQSFQSTVDFPVRIIKHVPGHMADNWNHSVQHAQGTYIKFVFQDDVLEARCISNMMAVVQQTSQPDFMFCNRSFLVDEALKPNASIQAWMERYGNLALHWQNDLTTGIDGKVLLKKASNLFDYPLNKVGEPSTTLIRRDIFKTQQFCNTLNQLTDVEFYYRIFKHCQVTYVPEKLVRIRLHSQQQTQQNIRANKADEDLHLYHLLKEEIGEFLHPSTRFFPLKYKAKKLGKRLLGKA